MFATTPRERHVKAILHSFMVTKVEVFNENIQEFETINLVNENEINISCNTNTETITNEEIYNINLLLCTKEQFNLL